MVAVTGQLDTKGKEIQGGTISVASLDFCWSQQ